MRLQSLNITSYHGRLYVDWEACPGSILPVETASAWACFVDAAQAILSDEQHRVEHVVSVHSIVSVRGQRLIGFWSSHCLRHLFEEPMV